MKRAIFHLREDMEVFYKVRIVVMAGLVSILLVSIDAT